MPSFIVCNLRKSNHIMESPCFPVYLSSNDSMHSFPENNPADYTVRLPERLFLERGNWWCGLSQLRLPDTKIDYPVYLCSDLCGDSVVGEFKVPVLQRIHGSITEPTNLLYLPVIKEDISSIRLYLISSSRSPISFEVGASHCTLQFCQNASSNVLV